MGLVQMLCVIYGSISKSNTKNVHQIHNLIGFLTLDTPFESQNIILLQCVPGAMKSYRLTTKRKLFII